MGSAHSNHTNLGRDSTSFEAGQTGSVARWGDSVEVSMGNWKENDHTQVWGVEYKTCKKKHTCGFQLKATRDNNGVESIHLGLCDSSKNKTEFSLKFTRVGRDGLSGGIIGIDSSSAPMFFTRGKENCSIDTTIVSYGCQIREGLFVIEMKKKVNCENAYMVTLAHYFVINDFGLSVMAKICREKGNGFGVEVEGPLKHPSADLRKVLVKTSRTGVWSPKACSHCKGEKGQIIASGVSNPSLKKPQDKSNHQRCEAVGKIAEDVALFSSNVTAQYNKGLINSSGYTSGSFNNSIIVIMNSKTK